MSLKPDKKSDAGKSWSKPRPKPHRSLKIDYHLIVTEGTKTEPYYFQGLKAALDSKNRPDKVVLDIHGEGRNTTGLVERAVFLANKAGFPYQHVWLVYDKDDFPAENFNEVTVLCQTLSKGSETQYHAIWSNQCIELWYLLHFSLLQSDLHRSEYYPKLTDCLIKIGKGKYEKNLKDMFQTLYPLLDTAIMNSQKLSEINKGKSPAQSAPGTMLHTMLAYFRPYI